MARHALFAYASRYDELELGLRVAKDLAAREHAITVVGPRWSAEHAALAGVSFAEMDGEDVGAALAAACEENDSVLVLDLLSVGAAYLGSSSKPPENVVALDPWNIGAGGRVLDAGAAKRELPRGALLTEKRLVPSPCAPPTADDAFRATPDRDKDGAARRDRARRALGVEQHERVLLVATGGWQREDAHADATTKALARRVPELVGELVRELGEDVRVLHVGPAPMPWELGDRYRWVVPASAERTHNRFAAADALVTLDASSSALGWALAWRVPSIVLMSSCAGDTLAKVKKSANFELTARARAWAERALPLHAFRAWPLGLFETLEPAADHELSYMPLELLDERGFVEGVRAYLFDEAERRRATRDQDAIAKSLENLPSGADLWEMMAAAR